MEKQPLTTPGQPSSKPQAESIRPPGTTEQQRLFPELLTGSHPTLSAMVRNGDILTRDEYLSLEHLPDPVPDPYPPELEVRLPRAFQLTYKGPDESEEEDPMPTVPLLS